MTWLLILPALSLGAILGVLVAGLLSALSREARDAEFFGAGIVHGLELAAEAAREAGDELVGAEHRAAQIQAAREGRQ